MRNRFFQDGRVSCGRIFLLCRCDPHRVVDLSLSCCDVKQTLGLTGAFCSAVGKMNANISSWNVLLYVSDAQICRIFSARFAGDFYARSSLTDGLRSLQTINDVHKVAITWCSYGSAKLSVGPLFSASAIDG